MMMVSAVPLNPLLMILAVALGIGVTVIGAECLLWLYWTAPQSEQP